MQSILLLEDVSTSRRWLLSVLQEVFPGTRIHEADSVAAARQHIGQSHFNLAVIDINLPDGSGIDIARLLSQDSRQTYVVMATIYDDDYHIFEALKAGAHGYLLKDQPRADMIDKLQGILKGDPPLSPSVARRILRYFNQMPDAREASPLSKREEEVLVLIAKGYHCGEVSEMLGLSANTVAGYTKSIYRKLKVSSRAEVALEATRLGLVRA